MPVLQSECVHHAVSTNLKHICLTLRPISKAALAPRRDWQPRQAATYSGSSHWQRHRTATGFPWPTAPGHGPAHYQRPVSVKTEQGSSLGMDARWFKAGPASGDLNTTGGDSQLAPCQRGGETRDANEVKQEPTDSLIHPVKEGNNEPVLTEASKPRVGAIDTTPSSCKAEDAADAGSKPVIAEPPPPSVILSAEQQEVLDMVGSGQNVFFTGSAGAWYTAVDPCELKRLTDAVHTQ